MEPSGETLRHSVPEFSGKAAALALDSLQAAFDELAGLKAGIHRITGGEEG